MRNLTPCPPQTLDRIVERVREHHAADFAYGDDLIHAVRERCNDPDSGARTIDRINPDCDIRVYDTRLTAGPVFSLETQYQASDRIAAYGNAILAAGTIRLGSSIRPAVLGPSDQVILAGMSANLCVESHLRALLEQGFEVAVVKDATAAAKLPEGDGYLAALTNFRYSAGIVGTF